MNRNPFDSYTFTIAVASATGVVTISRQVGKDKKNTGWRKIADGNHVLDGDPEKPHRYYEAKTNRTVEYFYGMIGRYHVWKVIRTRKNNCTKDPYLTEGNLYSKILANPKSWTYVPSYRGWSLGYDLASAFMAVVNVYRRETGKDITIPPLPGYNQDGTPKVARSSTRNSSGGLYLTTGPVVTINGVPQAAHYPVLFDTRKRYGVSPHHGY